MRILPTVHFTHKNIALILVATILVGGAFALAEFRNKKTEKVVYSAPNVTITADSLSSDLQDIDSDNDGLKDWEEVLLGTDPDKADSDGDGTSDGKEATSGRNPLVKGPGDKAEAVKSASVAAALTPTEKLARDFFARYMELSQAGLTKDEASKTELINEVLRNGIVVEKARTYQLADIRTSLGSSAAALTFYGTTVGSIFKKYPHPEGDEAAITKASLEAEDPEILKQIDPIIANYNSVLKELLQVSAPESIAPLHLNLVNAVSKFVFVAESLRKTDVDTLKGIQGAAGYLDAGDSFFNALKALVNLFASENITFAPGDGGDMFNKTQ